MNYDELFNEYLSQNSSDCEESAYRELWTEWHDGSDNNGWSESNSRF